MKPLKPPPHAVEGHRCQHCDPTDEERAKMIAHWRSLLGALGVLEKRLPEAAVLMDAFVKGSNDAVLDAVADWSEDYGRRNAELAAQVLGLSSEALLQSHMIVTNAIRSGEPLLWKRRELEKEEQAAAQAAKSSN